MHGTKNIKFATAQQAKQMYQYKKIKEKQHKEVQQNGITKTAGKNNLHQSTYHSR